MALSTGGASKKARRNRYHYRLVIPDKGVYRANRADEKPWWMWHEEGSQCWYAGPERDTAPPDMTPAMFDNSHIDTDFMSLDTITRPGPHAWRAWNNREEDWMDDAFEFTTEVDDERREWGLYTPGEVLCYGWYDPDVEDGDDDMETGAVGSFEPLRGIWLVDAPPPPPPPPLPAPTGCPPLPQLPAAAPTTPPEAYMRPKAAPTASSASSASASASAPPFGLGSSVAAAKSRWGSSARRSYESHGIGCQTKDMV